VIDTVTEEKPRPRIELEAMPAPRLEAGLPALVPVPERGVGTLSLVLGGAAILAVGLAALGTANFAAAQFARSVALGWFTVAVAVAGFGLIGAGVWRELRGLFGIETVDRLRVELASADALRARPLLRRWLARLPEGEVSAGNLDALDDPEALRALLRAGPIAELRGKADALGRTAAVQIFAITAAVPSPAFDGLLVAWRGTRLVRQIAELHGMRPGLLGTFSLLRRTALSAAGVMATDMAANTLTHALLSNPLLGKVAGDMAGAGVAARRMIVLARAAAAACSPLPPGTD
jgi:putative membrane protein